MRAFDIGDIKPSGVYLFSSIERLTGITRQTLRRAADQRRLIVFRDRPSMTKGAWFLDYLTDRKSLKSNLGGIHGQKQRLPRVATLDEPNRSGDNVGSDMEVSGNTQIHMGEVKA